MKKSRFKIKITFVGWLFFALCLSIGLSGLNTGNNLLYLVFAMMLSFLILSGILSNNTLSKITLLPNYPARIFAKQEIRATCKVVNEKKWFPSYAISIFPHSNWIANIQSNFIVKIPKVDFVHTKIQFSFPNRGYQPLPEYILETHYPFGLLKKYITASTSGQTLVFPQLFPIDTWIQRKGILIGEKLSGQKGSSGNPYGIRNFFYGDHYRHIHWKSSAKNNELRIKEFETEKRNQIQLYLYITQETDLTLQEAAISVCASLLQYFTLLNHQVSLFIHGEPIPNKNENLDVFYSALALAKPSENTIDFSKISPESNSMLIANTHKKIGPPFSTTFLPEDLLQIIELDAQ